MSSGGPFYCVPVLFHFTELEMKAKSSARKAQREKHHRAGTQTWEHWALSYQAEMQNSFGEVCPGVSQATGNVRGLPSPGLNLFRHGPEGFLQPHTMKVEGLLCLTASLYLCKESSWGDKPCPPPSPS